MGEHLAQGCSAVSVRSRHRTLIDLFHRLRVHTSTDCVTLSPYLQNEPVLLLPAEKDLSYTVLSDDVQISTQAMLRLPNGDDHAMLLATYTTWVSFKIGCFVYRSLHGTTPTYLSNLLTPYSPTRGLRSSDLELLTIPRTKTTFGSRGFRCAGPRLWNSLPHNIRSLDTFSNFKSHLKTHLFCAAFNLPGH